MVVRAAAIDSQAKRVRRDRSNMGAILTSGRCADKLSVQLVRYFTILIYGGSSVPKIHRLTMPTAMVSQVLRKRQVTAAASRPASKRG